MKLYTILYLLLLCSHLLLGQKFTEANDRLPIVEARHGSINFSDVDNDGDFDILFTGHGPEERVAILYINDGDGNYSIADDVPFEGVWFSSVAFSDIDNDGDFDVLITGENNSFEPSTKLYTNDGSGNFTEVINTPFVNISRGSIAFSDIDNDNDFDVLITGEKNLSEAITKLYTNDGNGNFTEVPTSLENVRFSSIAFSDIDNDDDFDLLMTGRIISGSPVSRLYKNDGNGNFTEVQETVLSNNGVGESSIAFSDIDNDSDFDVLITGRSLLRPISKLFKNDGNGNFTEVLDTPFSGATWGVVAFSDIDNDDDFDVLIGGHSDLLRNPSTKLYTNDGNGNFTELIEIQIEATFSGAAAFSDIDNDNDSDLFISGINNNANSFAKLYINDAITSSVNVKKFPPDIQIHPNPIINNTKIIIDYPVGFSKKLEVEIFNSVGRRYLQQEIVNQSTENQIQLNTQALEKGIYFIHLKSSTFSYTKKIIIY